jgi:RHS repeat-associated protein
VLLLTMLFTGARSAAEAAEATVPAIAQKIAMPAYINPTSGASAWTQLAGSSPGDIGFVVANVLNGPDYAMNPTWASVMEREHAEGVKVLGYVDTGYFGTTGRTTRLGSTAIADWTSQIEEDVNSWYAFYGQYLSGIFFDDAQNVCGPAPGSDAWADLYSGLTAYVKKNHPGAMTVDNSGSGVPQCYESSADVLVTFEGDYSSYTSSYVPLSWTVTDPEKVWHIVYDVPTASDMENVVALSKQRGAGYVYVTDATLPNPYGTLPETSYWDDEEAQLPPGGDPGSVAPLAPTGLSVSSIAGDQATIGWDASTPGSQPVAAYDVYRNNVWLAAVPAGTTSYTATDLEPSTGYDFAVSARDAFGNTSGQSAELSLVTSAAGPAPPAPADVTASSTTYTSTALAWSASSEPDGSTGTITGYNIYANGTEVLSVPSSTTSLVVGGLAPDGTAYSFEVQATDSSGSVSALSSAASTTTQTLPGGQMITSPSETASGGTFIYSADYLMPFAFRRVYIATGGPLEVWSASDPCFYTGSDPSICANYVIENDALDRYTGDGTDWQVTEAAAITPVVNGYEYSWTVPATDLGSPASQQYVFNGDGDAPESYGGEISDSAGPTLTGETTGGPNPSEAQDCQPCTGGPVDSLTGRLSEVVTDMTVPGRGAELDLERTYDSSMASSLGPFGYGWTSSYAMSIGPDATYGPSVMDVTQENGSVVDFAKQPDGSWAPPSRVFASLVGNADGTWTFTRHDGESFKFSSAGQLIAESDLNGDTTTLWYSGGKLATVTDPAGRALTFTYSGPLVTEVTDSSGRSVTYAYNSADDLTGVTDVDGGTWQYGYGAGNLLTSSTRPGGGATSYAYNSADQVESETGPLSRTTKWSYAVDLTTLSGTTVATGPEGVETQYAYSDGDLVAQTDAYGTDEAATTLYTYDPVTDQVAAEVGPDGHETTYTYDREGDRTSETDPMGRTTTWTYNGYGEVTSMTLPATYGGATLTATATTTTTLTATATTTTTLTSTAATALTSTAATALTSTAATALTSTAATALAPTSTLTATATTTYTYDEPAYSSGGAGNLTSISTPVLSPAGDEGTQVTHFVHGDPAHPGDVTAVIGPDGGTWAYTYDMYGDVTSQTAPATSDNSDVAGPYQDVTRWAYDAGTGLVAARMSGRYVVAHPTAVSCTPPAAGCTTYTYNNRGELLTVTDGDGTTTRNSYDADGDLTSVTDGDGGTTRYVYDAADQPTAVTLPSGATSTFQYWPDGQVEDQLDAGGLGAHYTYDDLGHMSTSTNADGQTTGYMYDRDGDLLAVTAPGASGCTSTSIVDGCTVYTYDADNEETGVKYGDPATPEVTYTYDADGRVASMTDGTGTSAWSYDSLGRTTSTTDGAGATTTYGYDNAGNVTSIAYPGSAGTVYRSFDPAGRMSSVTDWEGNTTSFTYDADGDLTSVTGPTTAGAPVVDSYTYDPAGDLSGVTMAQGPTGIASFTYARDADGQVTAVSSTGVPGGDQSYAYDGDGRLTSSSTATYGYDPSGNPIDLGSATQTFDPAGELTSRTGGGSTAVYTYDAEGERTTAEQSGPDYGGSTYVYNQAGELTGAVPSLAAQPDMKARSAARGSHSEYRRLEGSPIATTTFSYDGNGLRTSETSRGVTTGFTWDTVGSARPVVLTAGTVSYLYGPDGFPLEQMDGAGALLWYHHDQLGSTRVLTDLTGAAVGTASYSAYGLRTATTGATTPLGYAGGYLDASTGLIYLVDRYYDPSTGEFLSVGPLVAPTGQAYQYARDDPTNFIEPLGLVRERPGKSAMEPAALVGPAGTAPGGQSYLPGPADRSQPEATSGQAAAPAVAESSAVTESSAGPGSRGLGKSLNSFVDDLGTVCTLGPCSGSPGAIDYGPGPDQMAVRVPAAPS